MRISLKIVDTIIRQAYQEGHDDDARARYAAIDYLMEDFHITPRKAAALHDDRVHKCGLKDTERVCGEPSWVVDSDKCPDLGAHDSFRPTESELTAALKKLRQAGAVVSIDENAPETMKRIFLQTLMNCPECRAIIEKGA